MAAVLAVALAQLRRRRAATVLLALLAGLAAGAPMALWAAGRQAEGAAEHFAEWSDIADVNLNFCPPGFDPETAADPTPCFVYRPDREVEVVRGVPGVAQVARVGYRTIEAGPSADPSTWRAAAVVDIGPGASSASIVGDPMVIAGRLWDPSAPDEIVVREGAARALGVGAGDQVWLHLQGEEGGETSVQTATVSGVVRTPLDLLPLSADAVGGPAFLAGPGWAEANRGDTDFTSLVVWLEDDDAAGFPARLQERLGDQVVRVMPAIGPDELESVEQASHFEGRAAATTAAVAAAAALFLVGQAVARQTRAEARQASTLLALGMTTPGLAAAAVVRWVPVAFGGAVVAVTGALLASLLGPLGVARRGPWESGLRADWLVLAAGGVTVALLVPLVAAATARRRATETSVITRPAPAAVGSPGVRTGIGLAWHALGRGALPLGSAVVATGLALAAVIVTCTGAESLRRVMRDPARFGAPWDAVVETPGDDAASRVAAIGGVASATYIAGTDAAVGDEPGVWVQALIPVEGVEHTRPVMVSGREPVTADEIALGTITRRHAGARVGGIVHLGVDSADDPIPYRVVGEAMITDGFEPNVGRGAILSPAGLDRVDPGATGVFPSLAVELRDGAGRDEALLRLQEAFPEALVPFPVPLSLSNADRIAGLPLVLALGGALVAAITLTHALAVSVRRNRRELAVCRVLGFTGRQVYVAVATQATLLGLGSLLVGIPLGLAASRWGWTAVANAFGLASGPVVPFWVVSLAPFAALVVANLAAGLPARVAARLRPAETLRAE